MSSDDDDLYFRDPADTRNRRPPQEDKGEGRPGPKLKVELQTLRLNPDSQKLIMDTLKYVHGPDFELPSPSKYKDGGTNLSKKFWLERGQLVVKGGCDYSSLEKPHIITASERLRNFALLKLETYNFHSTHVAETFDYTGECVEKSLYLLFCKYFNINLERKPEIPSRTDIKDMREDEIGALKSMYPSNFTLKEKNLWSITIPLQFLSDLYNVKAEPSTSKKVETSSKQNTSKKPKGKERCKLFMRGPCRFGDKCRYLHESQESTQPSTSQECSATQPSTSQESSTDETLLYEIEIRIPDDSLYPYQTPLIFFKPVSPSNPIPKLTCLKITHRLIQEAVHNAQDGMPCAYPLLLLADTKDEILKAIDDKDIRFPDPSYALFPELVEEGPREQLPLHYKKNKPDSSRLNIDYEAILKENNAISRIFSENKRRNHYRETMEFRRSLPAWNSKDIILRTIRKCQVIVISGETGCGKTTQVPQYILDDWLETFSQYDRRFVDIVCTQPRRISAIGVAERVADERCEKPGQTVGYQIKLESKVSPRTRLTYCTTGMLLRRLSYDPNLLTTTHVIVDEVHERSLDSDFLLLILADLVKIRENLTVILMSATVDAEQFSKYFGSVPIIKIPGRTFPVQEYFLEDIMDITSYVLEENGPCTRKLGKGKKGFQELEVDLKCFEMISDPMEVPKDHITDEMLPITSLYCRYSHLSKQTSKNIFFQDVNKINYELIEHILVFMVRGEHSWPKQGSILIFLPGLAEIHALYDVLASNIIFSPLKGNFVLVTLHSTLSNEEQGLVFQRVGRGVRKIILSTNIAETSITIDDCVFVIDCGMMKERRFDSNRNMESLEVTWISRANAKQRKGRAGRVQPGVCVHLYTSNRYKHHMAEQPVAEMHRVPLEQLVLKIKILPIFHSMTVHHVLSRTVEPPLTSNIDGAVARLQDIGAMDTQGELTALGKHLAYLPVDVRIGKLIVFGAIFRCLDSALTIAACLSDKSPFISPHGKKPEADAKKLEFAYANSDQLTVLRAYRRWQGQLLANGPHGANVFAREHYISHRALQTLADIKHQLLSMLASIGFVPEYSMPRRKIRSDSVLKLTGVQLNENGDDEKILAAILCAALYPNVVKVMTPEKSFHKAKGGAIPRHPGADELRFKTKTDGFVTVHPSSINARCRYYPSPYLVYQEKVKTTRVFIRECSMVPMLPFVLFSGCHLKIELHSGVYVLSLEDGWIMFKVESFEVAEMLRSIRVELINLLEEKINDPSLNLLNYEKGNRIIKAITQIISKD